MKKLLLVTFIVATFLGCQEEQTSTEPSILDNYFADSNLPAAIMGSTNS